MTNLGFNPSTASKCPYKKQYRGVVAQNTDSRVRLSVQIPALALTSCVTLGELLNLFVLQFPH